MLVAIAYRYGQMDSHNYLITAGIEDQDNIEDEIIFLDAGKVHKNRGGKYGVAIWSVTEPGKAYHREIVHYFPSSGGEINPYESEPSPGQESL